MTKPRIRLDKCTRALSWWCNHFFTLHKSGLFLVTASLSHFQIIFLVHCLVMRLKFMKLCLHIQNTQPASLSHWTKLAMPFWVWWHSWDQMRRLAFCSTSQPKPKFHHVWQCSLQNFHHHLHGQQALYWHQHEFFFIFTQQLRHKFACNMMHAQIFSEYLMTHGFWNSNLLYCVMNGQTMIGTNKLSGCFLPFLTLKFVLNIHCTKLKFSPL